MSDPKDKPPERRGLAKLVGGRYAVVKAGGSVLGAGVSTLSVLTAYGVEQILVLTTSSLLAMASTGWLFSGLLNRRLRQTLDQNQDQPRLPSPPQGRPWEDQFVHVSKTLRNRDTAYVDVIAARLASARPGSMDARRAAQLMESARGTAEHLATCASNILQAHIQHPCTVTVLILRDEAYVDIFARNDTARARIAERRYTLEDNAATEHIISTGHPYYLCNGCAASPDFFYRARGWRDRFDNLCVIGIPNPEYERTRQNRFLGFMAVDSVDGRFDRLSCERWAQQFANHLSTCLYAWNKLEGIGQPPQ